MSLRRGAKSGVRAAAEAQIAGQAPAASPAETRRARIRRCHPSEPLSTTTISLPGLPASASTTEGRYFASRSLPFQLGITTDAPRRIAAAHSVAAGGRRRSRAAAMLPQQIRERQRQRAHHHQQRRKHQQGQRAQQAFQQGACQFAGGSRAQAHLAAQPHPARSLEYERELLLRAARPRPARRSAQAVRSSQVLLGGVQGLDGAASCARLLPSFGGRARVSTVLRPFRSSRGCPPPARDLGLVPFGHAAGVLLLARQFLLQFRDARAPLVHLPVERVGPVVALLQLRRQLAVLAVQNSARSRLRFFQPLVLVVAVPASSSAMCRSRSRSTLAARGT